MIIEGHLDGSVVKHLTVDFDLGHDLTVGEIEPWVELSIGSTEPAWYFLFPHPPFSAPSLLVLSLFLKNKERNFLKNYLKKLKNIWIFSKFYNSYNCFV